MKLLLSLKNLKLVLKDQLPIRRFLRNLWKGHFFGLCSKRSHYNASGGPKVMYRSKQGAMKAAEAMGKKRNVYFSNYKCLYCEGYHIGKNSENKG
jgi:hypothetical protein